MHDIPERITALIDDLLSSVDITLFDAFIFSITLWAVILVTIGMLFGWV